MIKPKPISWFYENLPEEQIIEDKFKEIIKKNYSLSGFTPLDTPNIERVEALTSKWADDSEIYWIKRLKAEWDELSTFELWLRFDLTVPLARYIAQYEWNINFPFKRQHIWRVYRWERPQKGRYREFYQADIDIIWNWNLPLFADVEILYTIYSSLKELNFWDFEIQVNNKKILVWFLESIWVINIVEAIWVIDKKDKVKKDKLKEMFLWISLNNEMISKIEVFIELSENRTSKEILEGFKSYDNILLQEWLKELEYIYNNLISLWANSDYIKINTAISRGLNYYTGTVFETFIKWSEKLWSIASWWRYENLASNFTKNNFPWVWWSIWLSRLLSVLKELWKIETLNKTVTQVLVLNMWEDLLTSNLHIVKKIRELGINVEIYLDSGAKFKKQLNYANQKNIPYVIIQWEDEIKKGTIQLKDLRNWEQKEIMINELKNINFN